MGFWDAVKELGKVVGNAAITATAAYGHIEQVINKLKEARKSEWPDIIDAAYDEAEATFPDDLNGWSQMFSNRLSEMEKEDSRFDGVHMICLAVIARRGLRHISKQ